LIYLSTTEPTSSTPASNEAVNKGKDTSSSSYTSSSCSSSSSPDSGEEEVYAQCYSIIGYIKAWYSRSEASC